MRKINREKCNVSDMFPDLTSMEEKTSERWFSIYENAIENILMKEEMDDNHTFTKDDIIDFFIKGASVAHKMLAVKYDNSICNFEELRELKKEIEKFNKGSSKTE